MSHKKLTEPKHYGSTNNTYEHLTDMSYDDDDDDDDDSSEEDDELELRKSKTLVMMRYLGGTICLIAMVLSWVTMAEKIQDLEVDYPHPYMLVYWVHSFYSLMYVVWKIWRIFPGGYQCNKAGDGLVSPKKMFFVSGYISLVSLISAYFWYLSLPRTSVAVNTSIYQSSCAAVFLFAIPLLGESISIIKVISLIISVGGVCMVGIFSNSNNDNNGCSNCSIPELNITTPFVGSTTSNGETNNTVLGIFYLLLSMLTYALLEVSVKKWMIPPGDTAVIPNSLRGLGLMGVHTLFWMWPPLIILHYTGVEVFGWPSKHILVLMVMSACLDITFNASLLMCIALVSPLFASVGAILAIPTAMMWDYFTKDYTESYLAYIGTSFIIVGFVGFVISEVVTERRKHRTKLVASQESSMFKRPTFGWV